MIAARILLRLLLVGALSLLAAGAAVARELSDAELDAVIGGTVDPELQDALLRFRYVGAAGAGHTAEIDGTLSFESRPRGGPTGLLLIDNGAQTDLSALVNINAVNSEVNVLVNMTINIESTVGQLHQINVRMD